jgi:hypothetical protein
VRSIIRGNLLKQQGIAVMKLRKFWDTRALRHESLEDRLTMAVSIASLQLVNDTGASSSDLITSNPAVMGTVTGTLSPGASMAEIQFDHNGDGVVDGSSLAVSGMYNYDPLSHDQALANWEGQFNLRARVAELSGYGGAVSTGDWQQLSMLLDRVAPTTGGLAAVIVDEGSVDQLVSLDASFADGATADAQLAYQVASNSNANLFDATTIANGSLTLDFKRFANGAATLVMRATDLAGNTQDTNLSVTVYDVNSPPVIVGFTAVVDTAGTWRISGTVVDDGNVSNLVVCVYVDPEFYDCQVADDGSFSLYFPLPAGHSDIGYAWTADTGEVYSDFITFSVV